MMALGRRKMRLVHSPSAAPKKSLAFANRCGFNRLISSDITAGSGSKHGDHRMKAQPVKRLLRSVSLGVEQLEDRLVPSAMNLKVVDPLFTEGILATGPIALFNPHDSTATAGDFSVLIDYGDKTPPASGSVTGPDPATGFFTVIGTHTYGEEGSYTATVTITDTRSGTAHTISGPEPVADAPLTASGQTVTATANIPFTGVVASFTDANPNAPLSDFSVAPGGVTVDWGDSTPLDTNVSVIANGNGSFSISGAHPFQTAGTFTVTVQITDAGGSSATATSTAIVSHCPTNPNAHRVDWTGAGDGVSWNDAQNWSDGVLPGQNDDVFIDASPSLTIVHDSGDVSLNSLHSQNNINFAGSLSLAEDSDVSGRFRFNGGLSLLSCTTFDLSGGGRIEGTANIADQAVLNFLGGRFTLADGIDIAGDGKVNVGPEVARATALQVVALQAPIPVTVTVVGQATSSAEVNLNPLGIITGRGTLEIAKLLNWNGGAMIGAGTSSIGEDATANINGTFNNLLSQRSLLVSGTVIAKGDPAANGGLTVERSARIVIFSEASFKVANGFRITGTATGRINNLGTFEVTGDGGFAAVQVGISFANRNLLFLDQGTTLELLGPFTQPSAEGTIILDEALLRAHNFDIEDGEIFGMGPQAANTLAIVGTQGDPGKMIWAGTSPFNGISIKNLALSIDDSSTLTMKGDSVNHTLDHVLLFNSGKVVWQDAFNILLDNGTTILNPGVFQVKSDGVMVGRGAMRATFVNDGTFIKTGKAPAGGFPKTEINDVVFWLF